MEILRSLKNLLRKALKDEKACEHLIKIYGSKEKAVEASLKSTGTREEVTERKKMRWT